MDITENKLNEICRAFAMGWTIDHIAIVEAVPEEQVRQILNDNTERIQELKLFYKAMEV